MSIAGNSVQPGERLTFCKNGNFSTFFYQKCDVLYINGQTQYVKTRKN